MHKVILSQEQVADLVRDNEYTIDPGVLTLPELSYLKSSSDEEKLIQQASEEYGFVVDESKLKKSLDTFLTPNTEPETQFTGAVLFIEGDYSVNPSYAIDIGGKDFSFKIFIHHKSVIDRRHRALATALIKDQSIELLGGTDEEYLYETISHVAEDQLFEAIKVKAPGLPIFLVKFDAAGSFKLEEMGQIK